MTNKWVIQVDFDPIFEYFYIPLPREIVESFNFKEGDNIKWIDNGDGSWTLKKENEDCECENCGCHSTGNRNSKV